MRTPVLQRNRKAAHKCPDRRAARDALRKWFDAPLGRMLVEREKAELDKVLPNLFGYHLMQVGWPARESFVSESRIHHRMVLDEQEPYGAGASPLRAGVDALPFASASLDLVVLPHTLEYQDRPHDVLREAERCLIPEGHIVILGFNPWSLWGMRRLMGRRRDAPWCGYFYSITRIKDWLALLGFDTVLTRSFFYRPPLRRERLMGRIGFLDQAGRKWWPLLGGCYLLVAKKRVVALTPIRPRWRSSRGLVGGLAEPTLRRNRTDKA